MGSRRTACELCADSMLTSDLVIRPARTGEAAILTELCIRSKAHWGYDSAFMTAATRLLEIPEAQVESGGVLAAMSGPELSGVAAIVPLRRKSWFELSHLFVAPEHLRRGIGRALFDAAMALAAERGATHLSILADPHAAAFYDRLGARRCGSAPSGVGRNRMLPLFELAIA